MIRKLLLPTLVASAMGMTPCHASTRPSPPRPSRHPSPREQGKSIALLGPERLPELLTARSTISVGPISRQ
jgi:hypothetical protein